MLEALHLSAERAAQLARPVTPGLTTDSSKNLQCAKKARGEGDGSKGVLHPDELDELFDWRAVWGVRHRVGREPRDGAAKRISNGRKQRT